MPHIFYLGDALKVLRQLEPESVHCVVTSPPYWRLRDYGIEGQIGLEKTPEEYVGKIVEVFREIKRVLRRDGTVWLNLGDTYAASGNGGHQASATFHGLKPKDLVGIPWRVAFALQADGWYLRSDIIWEKPNPMPESVTDRPTKAHEYIFLLVKSRKYYYHAEAIKEPTKGNNLHDITGPGYNAPGQSKQKGNRAYSFARKVNEQGPPGQPKQHRESRENKTYMFTRNKRSVWTIPTEPCHEAHFAVMPTKLVEPCILAGCPEEGWVLDPFGGSGTVSLVARQLRRNSIYIDLNAEYLEIAKRRLNLRQVDLFEQYEFRIGLG